MKIPYRTRKLIGRILMILLIVVLVAAVVWGCWVLWLQRFVVYTRNDGAQFRFDISEQVPQGQLAVEPEQQTVPIYYNEGDDQVKASQELVKVVGYYIDEAALRGDMNEIRQQISVLEKGTHVMIDVKNIYGRFFYSSRVSTLRSDGIDPKAVDELLKYLNASGMYTIARFPALRDYDYGLNHVPDGIHHSSGAYLYQDDDGCYWLNPNSTGTMTFVVNIIQEIKDLGFDEVVLTDFRFPDTDAMLFDGDKAQTLATTANNLLTTCGTSSFAVSFVGDGSWTPPTGRSRLYMEAVEASQIQEAVDRAEVADLDVNLVFVTHVHDTRFDEYGVLRPLEAAH